LLKTELLSVPKVTPGAEFEDALGSNLSFAWVINTEFEKKLRSAIQVAWHGAVRLW
jgi:hypothetical protein